MAEHKVALEAELPAAAAETLPRGREMAVLRDARGRSTPVALTWLDSADGVLAAQGLALEQPQRGPRRLLVSLPPPGTFWCPGSPAAELARLAPDEVPEEAADRPLLPMASFLGRATRLPLRGGMEAVLLRGALRGVTREMPVARLILSGPAGAVPEAMLALAETAPLLPPRLSLAEQARALAREEAARPRRQGAPRLTAEVGVEEALTLALGHLVDVMLWHAPAAADGTTPEGVHQTRVAIRRLRSLLRAFRPACDGAALRRLDATVKEIASALGPARDWDVWLGGLGAELAKALPDESRIAALLAAAREKREAAYAALRPVLAGPVLRQAAWQAVAAIQDRPWRREEDAEAAAAREARLEDFAAGLLEKRWRKLAEAGAEIDGLPDAEFHALRIQAKRMRYAAELFAPLWGRKKGRRFLSRLAEVQDAFGLANDAVVARGLMGLLAPRGAGTLAWAVGAAEGWALARARRARSKATSAWKELLDCEVFWDQD